ncbi:MAG: Uma2 family endonuclease [Oscillospiraceae bacterium]|jgi:Uma2 family endonuclease|nr:Uma2 family endonuclease [Oscillospiraceae bacterium]
MSLRFGREYPRYTVEEYFTWNENTKRELIEGYVYMMSPSPSRAHQRILGKMYTVFENYLADINHPAKTAVLSGTPEKCEPYIAPFDVELSEDTVVQPDMFVICDDNVNNITDKQGFVGIPDMVIEILSPYNRKHDLHIKYKLYEECGVKEYWIVDPIKRNVSVFILVDGKYENSGVYSDSDTVEVNIINGLIVDMSYVFRDI